MWNRISAFIGSGLLLLILVFGHDFASYLSTGADWVQDGVRSQVPVEFELQRARKMIEDLVPKVRQQMHAIAREEIEVEVLQEQLTQLEARQVTGAASLQELAEKLREGADVSLGSTRYTAAEAQELARGRLDRYRMDEQTLTSLRSALATRRKRHITACKQLDLILAAKERLSAEIVNLEARQNLNEVSKSAGEALMEDSHLARTRELIRELEARIQVEERLVEWGRQDQVDELLLQNRESVNADVAREITQYFSPQPESMAEADIVAYPTY